jgi:Leucine-rich repeat (LRR) protein
MQRIAIDKETYLVDVVYNADGRNPIYNHNQGLKLINLPDNYAISWKACGGLENNTPCFKIIDSEQNIINSNEDTNIDQVYILPDDVFSGSITNNYIEAIVKQNGSIIATVYAPINMTLNTFGLASLNA